MNRSEAGIDWDTIYWQQMPRIYNFFRYCVCDDSVAEDLTATTFERAWRYRDRYRHDLASFSTWLFTIARNVAKNHLRKRRFEIPLVKFLHLTDNTSLEAAIQHQDDLVQLARLVERLSDRERELISLKYGAELTNRAIAQVTGLSESNVGTILHRALQRIRVQWETSA